MSLWKGRLKKDWTNASYGKSITGKQWTIADKEKETHWIEKGKKFETHMRKQFHWMLIDIVSPSNPLIYFLFSLNSVHVH